MRVWGLFVVVALVAVLACSAQAASASTRVATAGTLRSAINTVRAAHGLKPLRVSVRLAAAAGGHSREMARLGYFRHSSADGTSFWRRIQRRYGSSGYRHWVVGENLLWSSGELTAAHAVSMWMHSPGHRENLLSTKWRQVGISIRRAVHAPGVFEGLDVSVVSADFGARY